MVGSIFVVIESNGQEGPSGPVWLACHSVNIFLRRSTERDHGPIEKFRETLRATGVRSLKLLKRSPNLNVPRWKAWSSATRGLEDCSRATIER